MHVLILHDAPPPNARPDETDVLVQAAVVAEGLAVLGCTTETLACSLDLGETFETLAESRPELVFNLVEGLGGHGRLIAIVPSLVEAQRLRMTGCPADSIHTTSNKVLAKRLLESAGLPTPAWRTAEGLRRGHGFDQASRAGDRAPRAIVKSVWEHASLGLDDDSVLPSADSAALLAAIESRRDALGGEAFAELYVEGREFNLALIEEEDATTPRLLPPAEILFEQWPDNRPRIVGYRAKWDADAAEYRSTPRRFDLPRGDGDLLRQLESQALQCWRTFGLRGYARVDFRVDELGAPWILEINTNPCLSPDAGFAAALDRAGLTFVDALRRLVGAATRGTTRVVVARSARGARK